MFPLLYLTLHRVICTACGAECPNAHLVVTKVTYSEFVWVRYEWDPRGVTQLGGPVMPMTFMGPPLTADLELQSCDTMLHYELVAVAVHDGVFSKTKGASGHWFSFIRTRNGWARCDDANVRAATVEETLAAHWRRALYRRGRLLPVMSTSHSWSYSIYPCSPFTCAGVGVHQQSDGNYNS